MTVDVEDYFHASAFDRVVSRDVVGRAREPRGRATRTGCSSCSTRTASAARSSSSAGSRSGFRRWCVTSPSRGHELASHGFHHQLIYTLTPDQFRDDVRRAKAAIEDAGGCAVRGYRAPSFSIVAIEPVGARRADRGRLHLRRQHVSDPSRSLRHSRRAAAARTSSSAPPARSSRCRRRRCAWARRNLPIAGGGYFRLLPYALHEMGHLARQRARWRAGGVLHPSVGNRSGPAAAAGVAADALRHYVEPRRHARPSRAAGRRFRLRYRRRHAATRTWRRRACRRARGGRMPK